MLQINHKHRLAAQSSETENILKINQTDTDEQIKKNSLKCWMGFLLRFIAIVLSHLIRMWSSLM